MKSSKIACLFVICMFLAGCKGLQREAAIFNSDAATMRILIFRNKPNYELSVDATIFPKNSKAAYSNTINSVNSKERYFQKIEIVVKNQSADGADIYQLRNGETVCIVHEKTIELRGSMAKAIKDFDPSLPTTINKASKRVQYPNNKLFPF